VLCWLNYDSCGRSGMVGNLPDNWRNERQLGSLVDIPNLDYMTLQTKINRAVVPC